MSAGVDHLKEELHVLVQCEDTEARAKVKLEAAVRQVKKLLVPPPVGSLASLNLPTSYHSQLPPLSDEGNR